jgi:hypothetical protein
MSKASDASLVSNDFVVVQDLVSSGPIFGFVDSNGNAISKLDATKAIYFDKLQLKTDEGTVNLTDVSAEVFDGYEDIRQAYSNKFQISNYRYIGKDLKRGFPVIIDFSEEDSIAIQVTVQVDRLFQKGGTEGNKVDVEVFLTNMTPGAYNERTSIAFQTFNGRVAGAPFRKTYFASLNALEGVRNNYRLEIEMSSKEGDEGYAFEKSGIGQDSAAKAEDEVGQAVSVSSYSTLRRYRMNYPLSAYAVIAFSAKQITSLPTRGYKVKGALVNVPENYEPERGKSQGLFVEYYSEAGVNKKVISSGIISYPEFAGGLTVSPLYSQRSNKVYVKMSGYYSPVDHTGDIMNVRKTIGNENISIKIGGNEVLDGKNLTSFTGNPNTLQYGSYYPIEIEYIAGESGTDFRINKSQGSSEQSDDILAFPSEAFTVSTGEGRSYGKIWNGKFYKEKLYTNNPAWIYNDIVTNSDWGLGKYVDPNITDKWTMYEISKYCDELVNVGELETLKMRSGVNIGESGISCYKTKFDIKSGALLYLYGNDGSTRINVTKDCRKGSVFIPTTPIDKSVATPIIERRDGLAYPWLNGLTDERGASRPIEVYPTGVNSIGSSSLKVRGAERGFASGSKIVFDRNNKILTVTGNVLSGATSILTEPLPHEIIADPPRFGDYVPGTILIEGKPKELGQTEYGLRDTFTVDSTLTLPAANTDFSISIREDALKYGIQDYTLTNISVIALSGSSAIEIRLDTKNTFISANSIRTRYVNGNYSGINLSPPINSDGFGRVLPQGWENLNYGFVKITGISPNNPPLLNQPTVLSVNPPLAVSMKEGDWLLLYTPQSQKINNVGKALYIYSDHPAGSTQITGLANEPFRNGTYNLAGTQIQALASVLVQKAEPRFTCNTYIQSYQQAYDALKEFTSIFRGLNFWAGSRVLTISDQKKEVGAIFTNANVVDGQFNYSSTSQKARYNLIKIRYNDPAKNYEIGITQVEDVQSISKYGIREKEIVAFACTSKSQAERLGRYIMEVDNRLTEVIDFSIGTEANAVYPGIVIKTFDYNRNKIFNGGRIVSNSGGNIMLDRPLSVSSPWEPRYYFSGDMQSYLDGGGTTSYLRCKVNHSGSVANSGDSDYWRSACSRWSNLFRYSMDDIVFTGTNSGNIAYFNSRRNQNIGNDVTDTGWWSRLQYNLDFKIYVTSPNEMMNITGVSYDQEATKIFSKHVKYYNFHAPLVSGISDTLPIQQNTEATLSTNFNVNLSGTYDYVYWSGSVNNSSKIKLRVGRNQSTFSKIQIKDLTIKKNGEIIFENPLNDENALTIWDSGNLGSALVSIGNYSEFDMTSGSFIQTRSSFDYHSSDISEVSFYARRDQVDWRTYTVSIVDTENKNLENKIFITDQFSNVRAQDWRVLAIEEKDGGVYNVTAMAYDPNIYDIIDNPRG